MRLTVVLALAALGPALHAQGRDVQLESKPARWRISYDYVDTNDNPGDDIGLVGVHYDVLEVFEVFPPFYIGIGGYGAVAGDSGGLFLGGVTLGTLWNVLPFWYVDTGVFLGGGGGGGRPENDGWAVRPFVAVERILGLYGLRGEVGVLDMDAFEDELFVSLGITLAAERLDARPARVDRRIPPDQILGRKMRITPRFLWMDTDSGSSRKDGRDLDTDIKMLGIGVDYFLDEFIFVPFEAYGATGGGVEGFAMGLAGLGVSLPFLAENLRLEAKGSFGAGGGGGVDVGGGIAFQALAGLRADVTPSLGIEAMAGRTSFPDGDLDATTATIGLSWSGSPVELALTYPRGNLRREGLSGGDARILGTRVHLLNKIYDPPSDVHDRSGGEQDDMYLVGLGVEQPLTPWFSFTGRAFTAYAGNAGGYAEGLLGAQLEYEPLYLEGNRFRVGAELGPAGGGGVDIDSGLLYHFTAGWRHELGQGWHFLAEVGTADANSGSFEAVSYTFGFGLDVHTAFLR